MAASLRDKYINAITDHAVRAWVYAEARRLLPNIGARCAITQYLFLLKSGAISKVTPPPTFTSQIEHLLVNVYHARRIMSAADLRRGDVCFSKNMNSTPGPDHVYALHTPLIDAPGYALIVDNYAVDAHRRNITAAGPKTPFDYALRLP
jgi:hypothetical protein